MARQAPRRADDPDQANAEAAPAATPPPEPPAPTKPDEARAAIERALTTSQPERAKPELNDEERQKKFTDQVKARLASPTQKDGSAGPRRTLPASRVQLASGSFRIFDAIVEEGTTMDDVLEPGFWAHCARKFNPWDQICVRAEQGTFYAELIVRETAQLWLRVVPKPGYPIDVNVAEPDVDGSLPPGWQVKWRGAFNGYCVIRNGEVIKDKLPNIAAGASWVRDWMKSNRVRA